MNIQINDLKTLPGTFAEPVRYFSINNVAFRAYGYRGYLRIEHRVVGARRSCWKKLVYGPKYQAIFNALHT